MRKILYIILTLVFILLVVWKADVIQSKLEAKTISIFSEWAEKGKPVATRMVQYRNLNRQLVLSGHVRKGGFVQTDISPVLLKKIRSMKKCSSNPFQAGRPCIKSIKGRVDPMTGLSSVTFFVPHDRKISPNEILAHAFVFGSQRALTLPQMAIQEEGDQRYVWVFQEDRVTQKNIEVGMLADGFAEVLSGLKAGDLVVFRGASQLNEGDLVQVVERGEHS